MFQKNVPNSFTLKENLLTRCVQGRTSRILMYYQAFLQISNSHTTAQVICRMASQLHINFGDYECIRQNKKYTFLENIILPWISIRLKIEHTIQGCLLTTQSPKSSSIALSTSWDVIGVCTRFQQGTFSLMTFSAVINRFRRNPNDDSNQRKKKTIQITSTSTCIQMQSNKKRRKCVEVIGLKCYNGTVPRSKRRLRQQTRLQDGHIAELDRFILDIFNHCQ